MAGKRTRNVAIGLQKGDVKPLDSVVDSHTLTSSHRAKIDQEGVIVSELDPGAVGYAKAGGVGGCLMDGRFAVLIVSLGKPRNPSKPTDVLLDSEIVMQPSRETAAAYACGFNERSLACGRRYWAQVVSVDMQSDKE